MHNLGSNNPAPPAAQHPRPLRVAVLAHGLALAGGLSVGRNLVAALGRVAPENRYLVTTPGGLGYERAVASMPGAELRTFAFRGGLLGRLWAEWQRVGPAVRQFRPDVLLDLTSRGSTRPPCPQAVLLQRAHFCYPPRHWRGDTLRNRLLFRYHTARFAAALRHTDLLLCQTAVMERRVRERHTYQGRAALCPNVVSADVAGGGDGGKAPEALRRLEGRPALLCLSAYYAHKNLDTFVPVFERHGDLLGDAVVVTTFSEGDHPHARRLLKRIRQRGLGERIVNVGPVPQSELAAWYGGCRGLILPTLLESFSATYIEAMRFGVPILTSDLDFAREVCGEAALYFDPWSPRAIAEAMAKLLNEPETARSLVERGRQRLAAMPSSWDDVARSVIDALREIAR